MEAKVLRRVLDGSIADEWDDGRDYLGMSVIGQCPRHLYDRMVNGRRKSGRRNVRRCHEGLIHEADVIKRLEAADVPVVNRGRELVGPFERRFLGHIDGEVDGDLLEIKTVEDLGALQNVMDRGARPRDRDQMQAYMRYGGYERALIVYKCRADGDMWVVEVWRDDAEGGRLEEKARVVLEAVDSGEPPACVCGRCKE